MGSEMCIRDSKQNGTINCFRSRLSVSKLSDIATITKSIASHLFLSRLRSVTVVERRDGRCIDENTARYHRLKYPFCVPTDGRRTTCSVTEDEATAAKLRTGASVSLLWEMMMLWLSASGCCIRYSKTPNLGPKCVRMRLAAGLP